MLLEICMANPDATRNDSFLYHVQYEIVEPLPQYMINMIMASWNIETARTEMEESLSLYSTQMGALSGLILNDLYYKAYLEPEDLFASDNTDYPALIKAWLDRIQSLTAKYDLVESLFDENATTEAESLLDSIPIMFNLSADQISDYNDFMFYYYFRNQLPLGTGGLSALSQSQLLELTDFACSKNNLATALASNALCHYYHICPEENYEVDISEGTRIMGQSNPISTAIDEVGGNPFVTVYPNPASDHAEFNYLFPYALTNSVLIVSDITGKEITRFELKQAQGSLVWNTSRVNDGFYYYIVYSGNQQVVSGTCSVKK